MTAGIFAKTTKQIVMPLRIITSKILVTCIVMVNVLQVQIRITLHMFVRVKLKV
jgi:hypothetical protein